MNRVLRPCGWEDLTEVHLVEVGAEIFELHPPVTIVLEDVLQLLFETLMIVPSLILISELTRPLSLSPRISDSNELEVHALDFDNLLNTIGVIEKDTRVSHSFLLIAVLVLHSVCATEQETLLVVLLELLPELSALDLLGGFWGSEMEFLGDSTSEIYQSLIHLTTVEHFIGSVEIGVSFLHEWHPELVVV